MLKNIIALVLFINISLNKLVLYNCEDEQVYNCNLEGKQPERIWKGISVGSESSVSVNIVKTGFIHRAFAIFTAFFKHSRRNMIYS